MLEGKFFYSNRKKLKYLAPILAPNIIIYKLIDFLLARLLGLFNDRIVGIKR